MKAAIKLNVLVACESSATVRDAFRALGHNAWSCDLLPCDGDPRYHVKGDVLEILAGRRRFPDWRSLPKKWDLLIAHPPCTYLCNSGVRWLFSPQPSRYNRKLVVTGFARRIGVSINRYADATRWKQMEEARTFFHKLWTANVRYVAMENPIPHKYGQLPRYTQIIQPWQFGHGETKATCLWLKNLPKLVPTDIVSGREQRIWKMSPGPLRWKQRSKTFEGIAKAMATQWSAHIIAEKQKGK